MLRTNITGNGGTRTQVLERTAVVSTAGAASPSRPELVTSESVEPTVTMIHEMLADPIRILKEMTNDAENKPVSLPAPGILTDPLNTVSPWDRPDTRFNMLTIEGSPVASINLDFPEPARRLEKLLKEENAAIRSSKQWKRSVEDAWNVFALAFILQYDDIQTVFSKAVIPEGAIESMIRILRTNFVANEGSDLEEALSDLKDIYKKNEEMFNPENIYMTVMLILSCLCSGNFDEAFGMKIEPKTLMAIEKAFLKIIKSTISGILLKSNFKAGTFSTLIDQIFGLRLRDVLEICSSTDKIRAEVARALNTICITTCTFSSKCIKDLSPELIPDQFTLAVLIAIAVDACSMRNEADASRKLVQKSKQVFSIGAKIASTPDEMDAYMDEVAMLTHTVVHDASEEAKANTRNRNQIPDGFDPSFFAIVQTVARFASELNQSNTGIGQVQARIVSTLKSLNITSGRSKPMTQEGFESIFEGLKATPSGWSMADIGHIPERLLQVMLPRVTSLETSTGGDGGMPQDDTTTSSVTRDVCLLMFQNARDILFTAQIKSAEQKAKASETKRKRNEEASLRRKEAKTALDNHQRFNLADGIASIEAAYCGRRDIDLDETEGF